MPANIVHTCCTLASSFARPSPRLLEKLTSAVTLESPTSNQSHLLQGAQILGTADGESGRYNDYPNSQLRMKEEQPPQRSQTSP